MMEESCEDGVMIVLFEGGNLIFKLWTIQCA